MKDWELRSGETGLCDSDKIMALKFPNHLDILSFVF